MGRLQTTASAGDPLKLSEINAQFNTSGQSLRAFLRDGAYVKSSTINDTIPTSGTIRATDLLGRSEVYITNQSLSKISSAGVTNTASVTVRLRNDGTFTWARTSTTTGSDTGTYDGQWLPGNKNPGDYSVQAVWTPITGGTVSGTIGLGVWSVLSTTQSWTLASSSNGNEASAQEYSGTLDLTIRANSDGVVLDTASISMTSNSYGTGAI